VLLALGTWGVFSTMSQPEKVWGEKMVVGFY
jgi:hypothetical protein